MGYVSFWVVAMFVVGFWYGVLLVNNGLPAGSVLTTFYATLASFQGVESLMPQWLVIAKGMSAGSFLSSIASDTDNGRTVKPMMGSLKPHLCAGDIELTDVSYSPLAKYTAADYAQGELCISRESEQTCAQPIVLLLPCWRAYLYRWEERFRKKHPRQPHGGIL